MFCVKCGTENEDHAKFCKKCGNALDYNAQKVTGDTFISEPVYPRPKRRNTTVIVAAVVSIALILVAIFLCLTTISKKKEEKRIQEYQNCMAQAENYLEELDYENAEAMFLTAIEIEPKKKDAYLNLADIYIVQEKYEKAIEILEKAEKNVVEEQDEVDDKDTSISDKKEELENRGEYTWVVEPTIEADDINYITETGAYFRTWNGTFLQYKSPYAVIQIGDKKGLIDLDGNVLGNVEYEWVNCWEGETYLLGKSEMNDYSEGIYELSNDIIIPVNGRGGVNGVAYLIYWCDGYKYVKASPEVNYNKPVELVPVKKSEKLCDREDYILQWWNELEEKYAICNGDQLVTDFIYDKCGSLSEGLFAVCQNGKWGYINENGETVIPLEYDASWNKDILKDIYIVDEVLPTEGFCYSASDGYVPLVKDGKWELRDIEGNLVILPGVFEEIRPVYEGRCWVKKNGKWGVISFSFENPDTEETEEEITERTPDEKNAFKAQISLEGKNVDLTLTVNGLDGNGMITVKIDPFGNEFELNYGEQYSDSIQKSYQGYPNGQSLYDVLIENGMLQTAANFETNGMYDSAKGSSNVFLTYYPEENKIEFLSNGIYGVLNGEYYCNSGASN